MPAEASIIETAQRKGYSVQRFVGRHSWLTLINGDSLELLPIICDAVVTDPPYGHGYDGNTSLVPKGNWTPKRCSGKFQWNGDPYDPAPLLALEVPTVLWGANHYASRLPDSPAWYVWDKRDGTGDNNMSDCELAWCNRGGSARLKRHLWNGLCRDSEIGQHLHPTQKPVVVMAWCMDKMKIPLGVTVLDPYMGSGTTGVACLRTGRNFIGIERDAAHYKTACDRIAHELDGALL
jgi:DNA modification methylase